MATDDIVHKVLQEGSIPPNGAKGERFGSPRDSFMCTLGPREPHLKRTAVIPEPMKARSWNHRDPFIAHRGVQVQMSYPLQELLLQKPFLHPHECGVVIIHRDHHGGVVHD